MEAWLADPQLLEADKGAKYSAEIHINMDDIKVKGTVCCGEVVLAVQCCRYVLVT
jgi:aconitase B